MSKTRVLANVLDRSNTIFEQKKAFIFTKFHQVGLMHRHRENSTLASKKLSGNHDTTYKTRIPKPYPRI